MRKGLSRRELFGAALGSLLASGRAHAASKHFELRDIEVAGDKRVGKRFTLLVPKHTKGKVPLAVFLHGLGETHDQRIGAHAWVDRYGLGSCYDRLHEPPVERLYAKYRYWTDERLEWVNALLAAQPLRGLAIACPFTPNVYKSPLGRTGVLDAYADWLVDTVIPRARSEADVFTDAAHTSLDGCSLGGYVGIEVFLRKPQHFGAWGTVQGALGGHRIAKYASGIAAIIKKHGPRFIHIETSTNDDFRGVNESLSRALVREKVVHEFVMPPGPHNQPFLRDSGTLEMLLWHDRLPR